MKTKTIELYEYAELPEDIKEKVLQENRYINVEDSWWCEPVEDEWKERLEAEGFRGVKIAFSGFCSQGDGASFTAESVDLPTFCKANKALTRFKALLKLDYLSACVKRIDSQYSHENTVRGDVESATDSALTAKWKMPKYSKYSKYSERWDAQHKREGRLLPLYLLAIAGIGAIALLILSNL